MDKLNIKELIKFAKTLKILYVEDNEEAREQILKLLENFFDHIIIAVDGEDGVDKFKENEDSLDIIFTDINMPKMNGIEMLRVIRKIDEKIPVIVLSAHNEVNFFIDTIELSVDGYILKPIEMEQFIMTLSKTVEKFKLHKSNEEYKKSLKDINNNLETEVMKRISEIYSLNKEIEDTQKEVILTMGAIVERRSTEIGTHLKRVAEYSGVLALKYGLGEIHAKILKEASPMHDIGKVAISDTILKKPALFTPEEFEEMKKHSLLGYEMLSGSSSPLLKLSAVIAYEHHERWDGSGYPRGLKGKEIDINGRITALADVFDALGSTRIYRDAWDDAKIFNYFEEEKGKHFEPKLVDIFFDNIDEFLEIRDKFKDSLEEEIK